MKFPAHVLILLLALSWCGPVAAATFTVNMGNIFFSPQDLTVDVGDTVTWVNVGGSHDTVSGTGGIPSGVWNSNNQYGRLMRSGETFSHTFTAAGTFPYYCTPHWPFGMVGTITVRAPNVAPNLSIVSPANNASFPAPATITIQAAASDPDGAVTQVQFFLGQSSLGIATTAPYTATTGPFGPGTYGITVTATDNGGATATRSITVIVTGAGPAIITPPQSQIVTPGTDVLFSVAASGSGSLSYQWSFSGSPITGATGTALLLEAVTLTDSGTYSVRVENTFGSASASAVLVVTNTIVNAPPVITSQPQSQSVVDGTPVSLSVSAIGTPPLRYRWFFNNAAIAGATNPVFQFPATFSRAGNYFAVAANGSGSATSAVAVLRVVPAPCGYVLSTNWMSFGSTAASGAVRLMTGARCSWTVVNTNAWVTLLSTNQGAGTATILFRVAANVSRQRRVGNLRIGGRLFSITQAGSTLLVDNDFNDDGNTDFLWQHSDGRLAIWFMNGIAQSSARLLPAPSDADWQVVATHDFNRDRFPDIVWQDSAGNVSLWLMHGSAPVRTESLSGGGRLGPGWRVAAVSDFNGDRNADFLFRHSDGYLLLRLMNETNFVSQRFMFGGEPVPSTWRIAVAVNLDLDAQRDLLWQSGSSLVLWSMRGGEPLSGSGLNHLPFSLRSSVVAGAADFNRDARADLLSRNADGSLTAWFMNGTNLVRQAGIHHGARVGAAWKLVAPK